jgi:PAS domain S-box-containing protein
MNASVVIRPRTTRDRPLSAIADFWHASIASAFRKGGDVSWVDAINDIMEQAPAAIAVFDNKVRYLAVSRRFLSDYELGDPAEVIGRSIYETFPDLPPRWREVHFRVLAGEEPASEEDFFPRRDGRIQWVRWLTRSWRTADGRIGGVLLFAEVITDQVAARRALGDSETQFRVTFENAPIGLAHIGPDGRLLRVNQVACRMLGYSADELTTKSFRDTTHPDDLAASVARFELMRDGKIDRYDAEKRYLCRNGAPVWAKMAVSCVRKGDRSIDYIIAVVEDISTRKRAEEELRNSEEQFRSLLLRSPLPVLLWDDREQILAVSETWLEETGYSRKELCRLEDWTTRAYPERSAETLKYLRRIISAGPQGRLCEERTIRTKDGRQRLWRFFPSAVGTESDGRRLFVSMAYDVTDRKAYEEQILFLMREVNHRAKNMLGLVQAIARQTAARQPEDFIGRFNERIRALAASQDLLVRNKWQGADVKDLIRAQLAHFADGSRIAILGPKLRLKATAAQAIGLALHELATNAGKYGALSVDNGRVDVGWRLEGDMFVMSWTERNGPAVSPPERHGFGSTVVDSMVKQSVGGEVKLDYAPSGLVWRLTCPAASTLEPGGT